MQVEYETHMGGRDMKLAILDRIRPAPAGSTAAHNNPVIPQAGSTITDGDILRSVSNIVGSACHAGTVKSPEELEKWISAAWCGFTYMGIGLR